MRAAADRRLAGAKAQWMSAAATVVATPMRGTREGLPPVLMRRRAHDSPQFTQLT